MTPFRIDVDDAVLDDLRRRLDHTRWPDELDDTPWISGTSRDYLQELVEYWRDDFDWRAQERALNAFAHFRADVDGTNIHFIHERAQSGDGFPLILTHGWPSTFFEMTKLIPLLTARGFDVVVPSLPGCGFSERPVKPGVASRTNIARLWRLLMTDVLGYARFGARGGDIGASITALLGLDHADCVTAIHVSDPIRPHFDSPFTPAEERFLAEEADWMRREGAYDFIQATKPQTLGYALNDSPAGLASWIVEKYHGWSGRELTKDELLTNITIYWVTETINSANRLYFERERYLRKLGAGERVTVPVAVALFPADIDQPPREYCERAYNVVRWTKMPRGGHFAAMEEPELLANDIAEFFANATR
ncbi:MAG TPA: epoxide hydrolase [Thermoanaerobaculia bacterium]|nr:epoxide hydrolase [Thermoanaerobaculia bacterium]